MANTNPDHKSVIITALAASFLILIFGLTYRVLATRLGATITTTPISPDALQNFPIEITNWRGREEPLDETIVKRTGTDAHISRSYSRHNGSESVSFYLACGVNLGDVLEHHPERCYCGAGWTIIDSYSSDLMLYNRVKLPCQILLFSRGDLKPQRTIVLYYIFLDGQYYGSFSLLRSRVWRILATADYVAQVQIAVSSEGDLAPDTMIKIVSDFAKDSAPLIDDMLADIQKERRAETTYPQIQGSNN